MDTHLFAKLPPLLTQPRKVQRLRVTDFCKIAALELHRLGRPIPPEREFRKIVRLFIRYIHRGRYGYGYPLVNFTGKPGASRHLAEFVSERWERMQHQRKKENHEASSEEDPAAQACAFGGDRTPPIGDLPVETLLADTGWPGAGFSSRGPARAGLSTPRTRP
jgi:hypothetical protein